MLFGYPIAATTNNWLNECLLDIITTVHVQLQNGIALMDWPDIIPQTYRQRLEARVGLRTRVEAYRNGLQTLSVAERSKVYQALLDQNEIALLLTCARNCDSLENLPQQIQQPIVDLYSFAFKLLTPLGIRDLQYETITQAIPEQICPFCGHEYFDSLNEPREDLDHYLNEAKYPFAGANLRNLVPMGMKCNQRHKKAIDMLLDENRVRRRSFDPYNHSRLVMSLNGSEPFGGTTEQIPDWRIEFSPDTVEVTTWDTVFNIKDRYKKSILDRDYKRWLGEFGTWYRRENIANTTQQTLAISIERYAAIWQDGGWTDRAFLKAAVFRMLHKYVIQGDQRLIQLLQDFTSTTNC